MGTALHWSGGKDSALALSILLRDGVDVDRLVTTVSRDTGASTVHEIPAGLLRAQAESIGLPLHTISIPGPGLDGYVEAMHSAAASMRAKGVDAVAFGDLGRSGASPHRQKLFEPHGIDVVAPLWELGPHECIERFLGSGISARTVVVDADVLGVDAVGVVLDRAFVDALPAGADPCGELGEFHTFAFDGHPFRSPVGFRLSPPRLVTHEIGTTEGPRTYRYWLATPRMP